jgi:hypothetical protein
MIFFSRGSHGWSNRGRGNWNRGPRRPRFSIHFDADSQELSQLFQASFFNWIGQGVVQPRPERPPFQASHVPGIPVPPHVSLQPEVLENDGWQEIVTRQSPNIVAGPICLYLLLLHRLTQLSKLPLHTHQYSLPT